MGRMLGRFVASLSIFTLILVAPGNPAANASRAPDPVLLAAGDIGNCQSAGDEATATLLKNNAGAIQTLGDNAYPTGASADFKNCFGKSWGTYFSRIHPGIGNHELLTGNGAPYDQYFGAGLRRYSYTVGGWHVVVLDGNKPTDASQLAWLKADLAANPAHCTVAAWHQPRFSSGPHGSDASFTGIWQVLYDSNVDLVLNGHDHDYERFAPQTPAGKLDKARGIPEFVVGTGGASHYAPKAARPNSLVRNGSTYGVLKLTLHPTGFDYKFLPVAGKSFTDSGTGACH